MIRNECSRWSCQELCLVAFIFFWGSIAAIPTVSADTPAPPGDAPLEAPTTQPSIALLPNGWEQLNAVDLASAFDGIPIVADTPLQDVELARSELAARAWDAYLNDAVSLDSNDPAKRLGWLHLAATVAESLDEKQRAAIYRDLSDHYLNKPKGVERLGLSEFTEVFAALYGSDSDRREDRAAFLHRWVLGKPQLKDYTIQQLTSAAGTLSVDNSTESVEAISDLVEAGMRKGLLGAVQTLGDGTLRRLLIVGAEALPAAKQRELGAELSATFVNSESLSKLSAGGVAELSRSMQLLNTPWQQRMLLAARWLESNSTWNTTRRSILQDALRMGSPADQALPLNDPANAEIIKAIYQTGSQTAALGSQATGRQIGDWTTVLLEFLPALPAKQREAIEADPKILALLPLPQLAELSRSLKQNVATAAEAKPMLQAWVSVQGPAAMETAVTQAWNNDWSLGGRDSALADVGMLVETISDSQIRLLTAALYKQAAADPDGLKGMKLEGITALQSTLSKLGDHSLTLLTQWLNFDPPSFAHRPFNVKLMVVLMVNEYTLPGPSAIPPTSAVWGAYLDPIVAALDKQQISIRFDGAKMLAYAFLAAHQQEKWQALLTRKIQDPSLSGDQKAHWLMAQAFFDEEFIAWAPELHWRNPPPFGAAMPWRKKRCSRHNLQRCRSPVSTF